VAAGEVQADDADGEPGQCADLEGGHLVAHQQHPQRGGADRADADPDGVGGADVQGAQREVQQPEADDGEQHEARAGQEFGEALAELQAEGHRDFEESGDDDEDPGHGHAPG